MPNLTLSMIVKNEEKYLRDCLESVRGVVDEIVIVDTGSTDSTLEIAKEFDAKIYHFDWVSDFSAARNYALSKSTGEWILYLDADERLSPDSVALLNNSLAAKEQVGIKCTVKSFDEKGNISQSMKYTRLFKNYPSIKFIGKVHEQIEPSLKENNYKIINSEIEIIHQGYSVKREDLQKKAERNLNILLEEFKTNGSSIITYHIANSYSILNDITEAANYYKLALADKQLNKEFKTVCYSRLADFEMRNNNLQKALIYIKNGLKIDKNNVLINLITAQIYEKSKAADSALKYCKIALQQNLLSNNCLGNQKIYIDNKKILYEGIIYSLQFNNQKYLQYFLKKFNVIDNNESEIISYLVYKKDLSKDKLGKIASYINNNNLEFYLKVFERLSSEELKLELYSILYDKFPTNSKYLNSFGSFLIDINQLNEAKIIFETAFNNNNYEDSSIFYLASLYLKTNELAKLENLITLVETSIDDNPLLSAKINQLKSKVAPILSRSTSTSV